MSTKEKTEVDSGVGALGKERVEGEPGPEQMCQDCAVFGPRVGPRQQQQRVCRLLRDGRSWTKSWMWPLGTWGWLGPGGLRDCLLLPWLIRGGWWRSRWVGLVFLRNPNSWYSQGKVQMWNQCDTWVLIVLCQRMAALLFQLFLATLCRK